MGISERNYDPPLSPTSVVLSLICLGVYLFFWQIRCKKVPYKFIFITKMILLPINNNVIYRVIKEGFWKRNIVSSLCGKLFCGRLWGKVGESVYFYIII